jgi:hypothetical protein
VLLDENLDHALRKLLGPHDVSTVTYMGWAGLKNGELLQAAEDDGFAVFLTGDQTLAQEQNLAGRRLAVVALSAIQLPIIRESLARVDCRHRQRRARQFSTCRVRHLQPQEAPRTTINTGSLPPCTDCHWLRAFANVPGAN